MSDNNVYFKELKKLVEEFQEGIFALRTRRFGTVAEIMIQELFHDISFSHDLAYDLIQADSNKRIEVKFSTVMKENETRINSENVIDQCLKGTVQNRMMSFEDAKTMKFDCNIQQIKRREFDILYYGLFFKDKIMIFRIPTENITSCLGYSDFQHRGNEGEGQFHINNDTISYHIQNWHVRNLTYEELYKLFKEHKEE